MRIHRVMATLLAGAGSLAGVPVLAQDSGTAQPSPADSSASAPSPTDTAAAARSDTPAPGEIIVTARRRAENIEKVPIAISVISGEDLVKRAIFNENDLQSAVPGLVIRQNGGNNAFNYVIRGQSVDTFTNSPPSVLPYVNEVQIVTHSASTFYDMGGIQVLKGPQGTLFGRNATGGAVLYATAPATDSLSGYVDGRYSSFDTRHVEGALNLPLGDLGALRVAGSLSGGGAFVRDYFTGQDYGDLTQRSIRGTLKLTPAPGLTNTTVGQYTREHGTNTPYELFSTNRCGTSAQGLVDAASCALSTANPVFTAYLAAHPGVYQGGLDAAIDLQRSLGPWTSLASFPPFHRANARYVINTTTYDVSPQLTLKNIFGYNLAKSADGYDYDGSPYHFFETQGTLTPDAVKVTPDGAFALRTRQISDEFQVQGKALDNRLIYVLGVYYLKQTDDVVSPLDFGNFAPIQPAARFAYTAAIHTESIAGFGQATYKLTDKLSLTGGIRFTHDKTRIEQLPGSVFLFSLPDNVPERTSTSKPSWTASLDYQATSALLFYVAQRGSFRSGGYNYSVTPVNVTASSGGNRFLPETTRDLEVGVKYSGTGLGMPVTINADGYVQWTRDIQRSAYILTANGVSLLTVNVPRARITGVEADASIRPAEFLTFGASINYTHAVYTANAVDILGSTLRYGPFADVPEVSATVYAEVGSDLGNGAGHVALRGDYYGQTSMAFSNVGDTANPNTRLPGYSLVNARLTWSEIFGTTLSAAVFARNLANERYLLGGNAAAAGGSTNVVNPGMPRSVGGELRYSF